MKRLIIMLIAFAVSFATFAQKDELKAAEKALKKTDYAAAKVPIEVCAALESTRGA